VTEEMAVKYFLGQWTNIGNAQEERMARINAVRWFPGK
jgi:hypothetical protein